MIKNKNKLNKRRTIIKIYKKNNSTFYKVKIKYNIRMNRNKKVNNRKIQKQKIFNNNNKNAIQKYNNRKIYHKIKKLFNLNLI